MKKYNACFASFSTRRPEGAIARYGSDPTPGPARRAALVIDLGNAYASYQGAVVCDAGRRH